MLSPRRVKKFVQGQPEGLVKNNRPWVGLNFPIFYFHISVFQLSPWTFLMFGVHIYTEISQIAIFKGT